MVTFVAFKTKMKIWENKNKLKDTRIWIEEDYPKKVNEERKKLRPHLIEARKKGQHAIIKYNALIINGEKNRT